jgi:hypothetical protein
VEDEELAGLLEAAPTSHHGAETLAVLVRQLGDLTGAGTPSALSTVCLTQGAVFR